MLRDFGASIPFYVTRKASDGRIGVWSISAWIGLLILVLILSNLVLWGAVGVREGVEALF